MAPPAVAEHPGVASLGNAELAAETPAGRPDNAIDPLMMQVTPKRSGELPPTPTKTQWRGWTADLVARGLVTPGSRDKVK